MLCLVASLNVWAEESVDSYFSTSNNLVPVQVRSARDANYVLKINPADNYADHAVNSGTCGYDANELWYLVGVADSFKMYSRVAGCEWALTLNGTTEGAAATLTTEGTLLCLTAQGDGTYTISPKGT